MGFRVLQHKCAKEFDRVKHLERGPADLAPRAFPTLNQADENRSEKKKSVHRNEYSRWLSIYLCMYVCMYVCLQNIRTHSHS